MWRDPIHLRSRGLFITGTDTGVGKTVVTCALAWALRRQGVARVGVCKPFATGCRRDREGLVSPDAEALAHFADCRLPLDVINPLRFAAPLAPAVAAEQAGLPTDFAPLRRSLARALAELGLGPYAEDLHTRVYVFTYDDEVACRFMLVPTQDSRTLICTLIFPEHVPPCARVPMCEAINRANWRLGVGNFEMDMSDGEVQFRHVIATPGGIVTTQDMSLMMHRCTTTQSQYYKAFMDVIRGRNPQEAIDEVTVE